MTKAFALKISMKALFFFVVFLQYNKNRGRLTDLLDSLFFAERTRFELVVGLLLRQFSKLVVSATHPPLQGASFPNCECKVTIIFCNVQ